MKAEFKWRDFLWMISFTISFIISIKVFENDKLSENQVMLYTTINFIYNTIIYVLVFIRFRNEFSINNSAISGFIKFLNFVLIQYLLSFDLLILNEKLNMLVSKDITIILIYLMLILNVLKSSFELKKYLDKNEKINKIDSISIVICCILIVIYTLSTIIGQINISGETGKNTIIITNLWMSYITMFYIVIWPLIHISKVFKGFLPIILIALVVFLIIGSLQNIAAIFSLFTFIMIVLDSDTIRNYRNLYIESSVGVDEKIEQNEKIIRIILIVVLLYIVAQGALFLENYIDIKDYINYDSQDQMNKILYYFFRGYFIVVITMLFAKFIVNIVSKSEFGVNRELEKQKIIENEENEILMQRELERLQQENEILKQDDERMQREYERMKNKHKINLRKYSRKV